MNSIKNFICTKCLKTFDRKSNYIRHINRLTLCSPNKSVKNNHSELVKKYINNNFPKISDDIVSNIIGQNITLDDQIKKYNCDFCSKSFTSKSYYNKHVQELCARHLRFEQHHIQDKLKRIEKFKKENMEIKEQIYLTQKTLPRFYIGKGKLINVEKNYINFYEQKNTRPFGCEITDHLTDKFMKKMIMNPEVGMVNLIRLIHFNIDIPPNRNVFVKSRKFTHVEMFKKNGWETILRKDAFHNIVVSKKDIMDEYFEKFKEKKELKANIIFRYENFSNCLDKYISFIVLNTETDDFLKKSRQIYERICKNIALLLLNNQKIEVAFNPEQSLNVGLTNEKNIDIVERVRDLIENTNKEIEFLINNENNFKVEEIFENEEQIQENNHTIESDDESTI